VRFSFDDGGYIEFQRSKKAHHAHVIVAVRKPNNPLELLVNSAEIHIKQLIQGVESVSGPIILKKEDQNEHSNSDNSEY